MSTTDAIAAAFDNAIRQVDRAMAGDMRTATGAPAAPELERLRAGLLAQRDVARARGRVDPDWIGPAIRSVAAWAPADDVALIGALGAIARLRADDA